MIEQICPFNINEQIQIQIIKEGSSYKHFLVEKERI